MNTKTALVLLSVLFLFGLGIAAGRYTCTPPITIPSPPLPPKVVTVTVVKELPSKEGKVVERVRWQTKEVPVPVEVIREIPKLVNPVARVRLEASKFQGLRDGKETFGWKGKAVCEIGASNNGELSPIAPVSWLQLAEAPFDLSESSAETTLPPSQPSLHNLRLDAGLGVGSKGPFLAVGLAKRIAHRSRLGSAIMPDWLGVQAEYGSGEARVVALLGKEL